MGTRKQQEHRNGNATFPARHPVAEVVTCKNSAVRLALPRGWELHRFMAAAADLTGGTDWQSIPAVRDHVERAWPESPFDPRRPDLPSQIRITGGLPEHYPWIPSFRNLKPPAVSPCDEEEVERLFKDEGRPTEPITWLEAAFLRDIDAWTKPDLIDYYRRPSRSSTGAVDYHLQKGRKLWRALGAWPWAVIERAPPKDWPNEKRFQRSILQAVVVGGLRSTIIPKPSNAAYERLRSALELPDVYAEVAAATADQAHQRESSFAHASRLLSGRDVQLIKTYGGTLSAGAIQLYIAIVDCVTGEHISRDPPWPWEG
jgi:hypothetical protein